jgi:hypothetical protein
LSSREGESVTTWISKYRNSFVAHSGINREVVGEREEFERIEERLSFS